MNRPQILLQGFDFQDFQTAFFDGFEECLKKLINVQETQAKFLTRPETAKLLSISLTTLDSFVRKGLINSKKIGHRVLFSMEDIEQSLITNNE